MSTNPSKKILIILTGGTICSFADENGEQQANAKKAETLIVKNFREGDSEFRSKSAVSFDTKRPLNILSENMTVRHWNTLINRLKTYDFSKYDGVIILHGTDTLAYTSSLLSLLLADINRPVFMVSSQLPLYEPKSNGNQNFKTAVEHIVKGIAPNVYAAYRNDWVDERGKERSVMYIHYGAHLLQCESHSNNFYSSDMKPIEDGEFFEGIAAASGRPLLYECGALKNCVLKIAPYVGLDYSRISLRGIKVVLHHTYHSSTMSVNPYHAEVDIKKEAEINFSKDSIMYLKRRCDAANAELYIEPCNEKVTYRYKTTGIVIRSGVGTSWRTTSEMAYAKLLVGCALGLEKEKLQDFMDKEINGEFIR